MMMLITFKVQEEPPTLTFTNRVRSGESIYLNHLGSEKYSYIDLEERTIRIGPSQAIIVQLHSGCSNTYRITVTLKICKRARLYTDVNASTPPLALESGFGVDDGYRGMLTTLTGGGFVRRGVRLTARLQKFIYVALDR